MSTDPDLILVTGASGYVGACLVPRLLEKGYRVRLLVREPERMPAHDWFSKVEIRRGNLLDLPSLRAALGGATAAFYLVHNMSSGRHYEHRELESAANFASAADEAEVERIIYLGGLANPQEEIGPHMRSRLQTGDILRAGRTPVTEFRASMIIGSGSISFEMIRYLAEQLPVIVGASTSKKLAQPIAIRDVLDYLLAALETPLSRGRIFEIGGADVLPYAGTMKTYARLRGLSRRVLLVPWLPERLLAFFSGMLTPVPARIAGPLIGGMRGHSYVKDPSAKEMFPSIHPIGYEQAVRVALDALDPACLEPVWLNGVKTWRSKREGFFIENRMKHIPARPEQVFSIVSDLGGNHGWLYLNILWKMRAFIDRLFGGPGLRGRGFSEAPSVGYILDFYRVDAVVPGRLLRLKAELKAPGQGWMQWQVEPDGEGTILNQTSFFAPKGVWGYIYWYTLYPVHALVFAGLLNAINRHAVQAGVSRGGINEH